MKTYKLLPLLIVLFFMANCTSNSNNSNCTECSYTVESGETAGTVPSNLDGIYELTYRFPQTGSPFADGIMGTFTILNNVLTVEIEGQECITLTNPIQTSPSEWTFKDTCRDNFIYGVSQTTNGELNEINLGTLSFQFLGQFAP